MWTVLWHNMHFSPRLKGAGGGREGGSEGGREGGREGDKTERE